jgi:hypothetical protein
LRPALAVVLYQAIAFVGPDFLNKSILVAGYDSFNK